ncbi:hypothetical protein [Synechococcus phage Ssp-JY38]|nr:hypothetical protein [Synechococcus phage Yong-L2-223]
MRLTLPPQHLVKHAILIVADDLSERPTAVLRKGREHNAFMQKMRQWLYYGGSPQHIPYLTVCEAIRDLEEKHDVQFTKTGYYYKGVFHQCESPASLPQYRAPSQHPEEQ